MIFQWGSTRKVSIELLATSRHCRNMTERFWKRCKAWIKQNKQTNQSRWEDGQIISFKISHWEWRQIISCQSDLPWSCTLWGLDTLGRFSAILLWGRELSLLPVCIPAHQATSEKGSALKRKNLLPWGGNSLLSEYIPFQNLGKAILIELSLESIYSL